MYDHLKHRIYNLLETDRPRSHLTYTIQIFMVVLILLNVCAVALETVKDVELTYSSQLWYFEVFSVIIFTIEYLLRMWSCTINQRFKKKISGRIRFLFTPMSMIDLLSILPFYLPMFFVIDLRFIRILRLLRVFRMFKLGRYSESYRLIMKVLNSKKEYLVVTGICVLTLLIIASSLIYFFENENQPEAFSSIPAAMWWGVVTLTTVGYGDIYPQTAIGKMLASIIAFMGIGLFALPAGILASGFIDEINSKHNKPKGICPYCGQQLNKHPDHDQIAATRGE